MDEAFESGIGYDDGLSGIEGWGEDELLLEEDEADDWAEIEAVTRFL
jgi:hypothetical protein